MKTRHQNWLLLARGGMELSWRYAWVLFANLLVVQLAFPLPAAVFAMVSGAVITRISVAGSLRNYQKIAFQSVCFILISLLILYWIQYPGVPFWHFGWAHHMLLENKSLSQWLTLLVSAFFLWLFWWGGRLLIKGSRQYDPVCIQFDKDMGLFIALLIVYALVDVRTDLNLQNQGIRFTILAFFTFSLTSIVLSRHQTNAQKSFISGHHGVGIILSTLFMIGIFSAGTTLLAYPYLYHKAQDLLVILKNTAAPFEPLLIKTLLFIFKPRHLRAQPEGQGKNIPATKGMGVPVEEGWQAFLFKILGVGLSILIGLIILSALAFLVYRLALWLLKKDSNTDKRINLVEEVRRFLKSCHFFILQIRKKIMALVKGGNSAAMIYFRLLRWGRHSGLAPIPSDTPSEYGRRLIQCYPGLESEIHTIVEAFNREIYGRTDIDRQTLVQLASAYRRMRHLKHWPSRMKTWFYQSR